MLNPNGVAASSPGLASRLPWGGDDFDSKPQGGFVSFRAAGEHQRAETPLGFEDTGKPPG